ncbi:chemotaxis protein CheW [Gallaecimonas pentaromativorans]|uniref:Purine-binding chemotaxis protein CheW n=1 Tax=Gallaecimonas pentaromativorans TaxID=584787 RepID=A0A3N1P2C5_9GAMM|nr:chemotaxis protein CheW [Gallaecimonas pentaromativorans]ROQ22563.1 purine-binding chemotaxis protein CheW [Gallaecimonas pentaromativorans]
MSLMDDYFAALLAEPSPPEPAKSEPKVQVKAEEKAPAKPFAERPAPASEDKATLNKLLAQVRAAQEELAVPKVEAKVAEPPAKAPPAPVAAPVKPQVEAPVDVPVAMEQKGAEPPPPEAPVDAVVREGDFQVLLFDVAGLELAVPLDKLGGIHQIGEVSPLFGKPDWFKGLMLHRDQKMRVVDTARWVMPDKTKNQENAENYRYLVMLGDSPWGLACYSLVRTERIDSSSVRWRQGGSKRPWLAGMVKERMCALLDVDALLGMLDKGLGGLDLEENKGKA